MNIEKPELTNRLSRWQNKLLDLSLKNPLLSLRSNSGFGVWFPSAWSLAQHLHDHPNKSHKLVGLNVSDMGGVDAALSSLDPALYQKIFSKDVPTVPLSQANDTDTTETHVRSGRHRLSSSAISQEDAHKIQAFMAEHPYALLVDHPSDTLQTPLARMERTNRLKEEEAGIHVLFLAVGMVNWNDGKGVRTAPLVLIPVSLSRENTGDDFVLTRHSDDAVLNPALTHILTQNNAVDWTDLQQAMDVDRIDFVSVCRCAKTLLKGIADIDDEARLTLLSYAKHHMWSDLSSRASKVLDHPVVQRIMGSSTQMNMPPQRHVEWEEMDQKCLPDHLYLPLPADASQVKAIDRVDHGESLVIQGPPGTGKSQTITNLIAHLMTKGKRVLFVAEKLTALKVVHQRLETLGLGAFCLELHTQSSSKNHVLNQLQEALSARNIRAVYGHHEAALSLQNTRNTLNQSLEALHAQYPNGLSVFESIGHLAVLEDVPRLSGLLFPHVLTERAEDVLQRKNAAITYAQASRLKSSSAKVFDAWSGLDIPDDQLLWQTLSQLSSIIQACRRQVRLWSQLLPLQNVDDWTGDQFKACLNVAQAWSAGQSIPLSWRKTIWNSDLQQLVEDFHYKNREWAKEWSVFQTYFNRSILKEHASTWDAFLSIQQQGTIKKWMSMRSWKQNIGRHARTDVPDHIWKAWCEKASIIQANHQQLDDLVKSIRELAPNDTWNASHADFSQLMDWVNQSVQWKTSVEQNIILAQSLNINVQPLCNQALERDDVFVPRSWLSYSEDQWSSLYQPWSDLIDLAQSIEHVIKAGWPNDKPIYGWGEASLQQWDDVIGIWMGSQSSWSSWRTCEHHRQTALDWGLDVLIDALDQNMFDWDAVDGVMEAAYATAFVNAARMSHPEWVPFQGLQRELAIKQFQEESDRFEELTRRHVVSQMAERLRREPIDEWSDMNILKRETMKKSKHLATRRLIRRMPKLLPVLKPCLMMSPLSVSEYLSSDVEDFDVVIFDEASQIPTADAIGAVSRAKQVVVVGDAKQMPPSRLFSGFDDDMDDDDVDLDSILTECLASGMPSVLLNWHYRSRHEDLIAFSNETYYGGNLITFPSPDINTGTHKKGLIVHDVKGIYDRGGSGTNMDEAKAVVDALIKHLRQPAQKQSIGVVTFNQKQQTLIERLWDQALIDQSDLQVLSSELHQPLTIKNLESVQGDERDVIFFSTTFGKDSQDRFMLNFGPLGQLGGERRLNVAITRARDRMEIFSSFHPNEINPEKITHQGVRDLRAWLLFARGETKSTLVSGSQGLPDSQFEIAVIKMLNKKGWVVHPQVGCSGYRIDMAVVNPHNPHQYLAGIECDGATYHGFKTARDRDKQRQIILEGLGWNIERIWSTNWFEDSQREGKRIHALLEHLAEQYKSHQQ